MLKRFSFSRHLYVNVGQTSTNPLMANRLFKSSLQLLTHPIDSQKTEIKQSDGIIQVT